MNHAYRAGRARPHPGRKRPDARHPAAACLGPRAIPAGPVFGGAADEFPHRARQRRRNPDPAAGGRARTQHDSCHARGLTSLRRTAVQRAQQRRVIHSEYAAIRGGWMPRGWAREEVEATVASYFAMLQAELSGIPYNKAERRGQLLPLLNDRSEQSIEFKHANISAILIELGFPFISGYKPRSNYQELLLEVVSDRLKGNPAIQKLVATDSERAAIAPTVDDILKVLTDPPKPVAL